MSTTIKITAAGQVFEFTPEQARIVYHELDTIQRGLNVSPVKIVYKQDNGESTTRAVMDFVNQNRGIF